MIPLDDFKNRRRALTLSSPIEFVIIGPARGRDSVLLKSVNAGIDLVGAAGSDARYGVSGLETAPVFNLIFPLQPIQRIHSSFVHDITPQADDRRSRLSFVWRGFAREDDLDRLSKIFASNPDAIRDAIATDNLDELEWILGSLIFECSRANQRGMRRTLAIRTIIGIYAVASVIAVFVVGFQKHFF